jgi:hypothetical protein
LSISLTNPISALARELTLLSRSWTSAPTRSQAPLQASRLRVAFGRTRPDASEDRRRTIGGCIKLQRGTRWSEDALVLTVTATTRETGRKPSAGHGVTVTSDFLTAKRLGSRCRRWVRQVRISGPGPCRAKVGKPQGQDLNRVLETVGICEVFRATPL